MAKQAAIEQDGTIVEALSNAMFRVELENGEEDGDRLPESVRERGRRGYILVCTKALPSPQDGLLKTATEDVIRVLCGITGSS